MHALVCSLLLLAAAVPLGRAATVTLSEEAAEAGRLIGRHYSYRDYDAHHQTWTGVADRNGILYFGNKGCVLEFDGQEWRRIAVGATTFVRGLALAPDGTLYVGAVDEIGYLAASPLGGKHFVSLRDRLPPEHREFGDIWNAVATSEGVFFAAGARLLRWRDGAFHVWQAPGEASFWLHEVAGRVYVHRRGEPLCRIDGDALVPFSDTAFFRTNRVPVLLRGANGGLIACSADNGLALVAADGAVTPFLTEADAWLRREGVQTAAALSSGLLAIASRQAGVLILDREGRFVRRIDENDGLGDPLLHRIVSSGGQIWLCQNNGLTRLQDDLGRTLFGRDQGLDGTSVRAVVRHDGAIHAATGRGVFRLIPAAPRTLTNAHFTVVPGFAGRSFALLSTPHGLLSGENEGLQFLPSGAGATVVRLADSSPVVALAASTRTPDRVWAATLGGVVTLDWDGRGWRVTPPPTALRFEARSFAEFDDGTLWLGTFTRGVARVRGLDGAADSPLTVEFFKESHGLPAGHGAIHVARAGPHLVAACDNGAVLRYDAVAGRFVPAATGHKDPAVAWLTGSMPETNRSAVLEFDADGVVTRREYSPLLEDTGPLQQVFGERGGTLTWCAGADALGRHGTVTPVPITRPPGVVLRAALLDGQAAWPESHALAAGPHHLAFQFSASAFVGNPEFSSRLEGADAGWSEFSPQHTREFSNLPPGRYALHAKARNGHAIGNAEVLFRFALDRPWWLAWWTRLGAALAGLGTLGALVRWRLGALRRRNERLEQLVAARTAELRANEAQLRSTRDAAEAANRAKSAFLAHMSHELRTPLNGILGYAQVMAKDATLDRTNHERLRVISDSSHHLLHLINEVLDLSKIEAGRIELNHEPCDLPRLLNSVADIFRLRATELGLEFRTEFAAGLPANVMVDEAKLAQVLVNLLGNAFKFTPGGSVTLIVQRAAPTDAQLSTLGSQLIVFSVADTGTGIAAADLDRIFRPFVQVGAAGTGAQGTGLGLAISQRIVGLLGGELHVASEPGRGSRFWFELALAPGDGVPATAVSALAGKIVGYEGERRRVLVIDDNAINRDVLAQLLAPSGFDVRLAGSGAEGLALHEAFLPHFVLLDLRMTPMDGFAVARELRQRPGGAALKVVAVSASAFDFDRNDALRAGCDGFLPKPFGEDALLAEIGRHLGLVWVRDAAPAAGAVRQRPPASVIVELRALAAEGKVPRLRRRLAALRREDAAHAPFYDEVDGFAARFDLKRIETILAP